MSRLLRELFMVGRYNVSILFIAYQSWFWIKQTKSGSYDRRLELWTNVEYLWHFLQEVQLIDSWLIKEMQPSCFLPKNLDFLLKDQINLVCQMINLQMIRIVTHFEHIWHLPSFQNTKFHPFNSKFCLSQMSRLIHNNMYRTWMKICLGSQQKMKLWPRGDHYRYILFFFIWVKHTIPLEERRNKCKHELNMTQLNASLNSTWLS